MIYIAAPFFNPEQLALVQEVELAITNAGMEYFSPRSIGVLQDMQPQERLANMKRIFEANVENINACDCLLAILDYRDTGTTWELGYAYGYYPSRYIAGYTSSPDVKINVMLGQCLDGHIVGPEELARFLAQLKDGLVDDYPLRGDTF